MGPQEFWSGTNSRNAFDGVLQELPANHRNTMEVTSWSDAEILDAARKEIGKNLVSSLIIQAVQSSQALIV
jgi:hypothetical protein